MNQSVVNWTPGGDLSTAFHYDGVSDWDHVLGTDFGGGVWVGEQEGAILWAAEPDADPVELGPLVGASSLSAIAPFGPDSVFVLADSFDASLVARVDRNGDSQFLAEAPMFELWLDAVAIRR